MLGSLYLGQKGAENGQSLGPTHNQWSNQISCGGMKGDGYMLLQGTVLAYVHFFPSLYCSREGERWGQFWSLFPNLLSGLAQKHAVPLLGARGKTMIEIFIGY